MQLAVLALLSLLASTALSLSYADTRPRRLSKREELSKRANAGPEWSPEDSRDPEMRRLIRALIEKFLSIRQEFCTDCMDRCMTRPNVIRTAYECERDCNVALDSYLKERDYRKHVDSYIGHYRCDKSDLSEEIQDAIWGESDRHDESRYNFRPAKFSVPAPAIIAPAGPVLASLAAGAGRLLSSTLGRSFSWGRSSLS